MSTEGAPTSNTESKPKARAESVLDLPLDIRAIERARLVSGMKLMDVDIKNNPAVPIHLVGGLQEATAFLDLLQANIPPEQLGFAALGSTPHLKADKALIGRLDNGFISVNSKGDSAILTISCDEGTSTYHCRFGYSAKGSSIERNAQGSINIGIINDPKLIVDESLFKLYNLTGNPNFMQAVGDCAVMKSKGLEGGAAKTVDPEGHYAALGLNPLMLRFTPEKIVENIIRGIKSEAVKSLDPETASGKEVSETEKEYLNRVVSACDVLENKEKRDAYSNAWLIEDSHLRLKLAELQSQDYYTRLQVVRSASTEAINGAFQFLSKAFHPDRNAGPLQPLNAEIFKLYSEARATLIDTAQRTKYDQKLAYSGSARSQPRSQTTRSPKPPTERPAYTPPPPPKPPSPEELAAMAEKRAANSITSYASEEMNRNLPSRVAPEISIKLSAFERQGLNKEKILKACELSIIYSFRDGYLGRTLESWSRNIKSATSKKEEKEATRYVTSMVENISSLETLGVDKNKLTEVTESKCLDFFPKFVSRELLRLRPEYRDKYIEQLISGMMRLGVSKEKLEQSIQDLLKF